MKVIIAGSRHITDIKPVIKAWNDSGFHITEVVCGCARGVDLSGKALANLVYMVPVKDFRADWNKYQDAAGPIRNREMANYADALILIWDGKSKGSKNMKETMKKLGKPIYEVIYATDIT